MRACSLTASQKQMRRDVFIQPVWVTPHDLGTQYTVVDRVFLYTLSVGVAGVFILMDGVKLQTDGVRAGRSLPPPPLVGEQKRGGCFLRNAELEHPASSHVSATKVSLLNFYFL